MYINIDDLIKALKQAKKEGCQNFARFNHNTIYFSYDYNNFKSLSDFNIKRNLQYKKYCEYMLNIIPIVPDTLQLHRRRSYFISELYKINELIKEGYLT